MNVDFLIEIAKCSPFDPKKNDLIRNLDIRLQKAYKTNDNSEIKRSLSPKEYYPDGSVVSN